MNRNDRMTRAVLLGGSALWLATSPLAAQPTGDANPPPASDSNGGAALSAQMAPFAALAGSCWFGRFADSELVDHRCISPMLAGTHIRDRHRVIGGEDYAGEAIFSWDAEMDAMAYAYYNTLGGVERGTLRPVEGGFDGGGRYEGPDGAEIEMTVEWRITGNTMVQRTLENGREFMRIDFERRPWGAFPELTRAE